MHCDLWFYLDKSILWLLYLGSFGVTRFLKSGPMTMIPKFGTSFLLAMLSVAGTLVGKGLILAVLMFKYCGPCSQALGSDLRIPSIAVWVGVFLVPHLILVSIGTFNLIAMSLDFEFLGLWLMDFERLHYTGLGVSSGTIKRGCLEAVIVVMTKSFKS